MLNRLGDKIDSMFGTKTWYRVTGQAGNQVANYCDKIRGKKYEILYVWLNGTNPTVENGEVQRQGWLTLRDQCFLQTRKVMVRNCSTFLVYQFPDQRSFRFPPAVATMYKHSKYTRYCTSSLLLSLPFLSCHCQD